MKIGVVYPQREYGSDPDDIRKFAQLAEQLGYTHILAYDHVLGANPNRPGGWQGPYTYKDTFQEPFVLFSYLAAITSKISFATGILILPQRQTALVAKQAATLDVLSGGRLRLGIGIGWNQVEYIALNEQFGNRGKRSEEQVRVMRKLWTEPLVTFEGRWHHIPDAGIKPLPVQQPIPIWFGGHADAVIRRVAEIGDGWMPNYRSVADAQDALNKLADYREAAGRAATDIGLEPRLSYGDGDKARWEDVMGSWQEVGATHFTVNTMGCGFGSPSDHLRAIENFAERMLS